VRPSNAPVTHNETDEQLPHTVDVTALSVEILPAKARAVIS
jgi:hypothetical protein